MINLRKVRHEDIDLLFKWANDPVVRSNSFNSAPIPYEDHKSWFNKIMTDTSVLQFILESDELPIGQIRLNISDSVAEIGYSIAKEYRGKGYGHIILQLVMDEIKSNHPQIKKVIAKVKDDNTVSRKLFESEGYDTEYLCYSLEVN